MYWQGGYRAYSNTSYFPVREHAVPSPTSPEAALRFSMRVLEPRCELTAAEGKVCIWTFLGSLKLTRMRLASGDMRPVRKLPTAVLEALVVTIADEETIASTMANF